MSKSISETLNSFISSEDKKHHRFNSWHNCYQYFQEKYFVERGDDQTAALNLGFYLASWGMYRGSTFLLQNDYTIHIGVVKILKNHYRISKEVDYTTMRKISDEIVEHYQQYAHTNGKNNNTASDTLITKILLGTFGCVPAYDRFFIDGIGWQNSKDSSFKLVKKFSQSSVAELNKFYEKNKEEFMPFEEKYPKMKLLDMYFWKLGFDNA